MPRWGISGVVDARLTLQLLNERDGSGGASLNIFDLAHFQALRGKPFNLN